MTPDQRDVPGTEESRPAGPVTAGDPPPPAVAKASSGEVPPTAPPAGENSETDGDGHRPKASPLARRLANEQGLDLGQLKGSGPGGRIVKADVERASSA